MKFRFSVMDTQVSYESADIDLSLDEDEDDL